MMRVLLALLALAGPAEASSIVAVEPVTEELGSSMVAVDDGTMPHVMTLPASAATPSVVALGEPAAADETVAAIAEEGLLDEPVAMVIRGGILGGAFAAFAPAADDEEPENDAATRGAGSPAPLSGAPE